MPANIQFREIDIATDPAFPAAMKVADSGRPWYPQTPEDYREYRRFNEGMPHVDVVAEDGLGTVVGWLSVSQNKHEFVPGKFHVELAVAPAWRRRGLGGRLLDRAVETVRSLGGSGLVAWVDREDPAWTRWAEARGFACTQVSCDVVLDLRVAAIPSDDAIEEAARAAGVRVTTFAQLEREYPDARRRLHAMAEDVKRDIPSPDPLPPVSFEDYTTALESPLRIPDAQFVALRGDALVGMSTLWRRGADAVLETGITAVVRGERGKGLATLLKWHAVRYALSIGAPHIITDNAEENAAMRAINARLGFTALPGTWRMERSLAAG
ncbi:MAG: GNAT family N-acetyltransferase [Armatimonadota bacterium]